MCLRIHLEWHAVKEFLHFFVQFYIFWKRKKNRFVQTNQFYLLSHKQFHIFSNASICYQGKCYFRMNAFSLSSTSKILPQHFYSVFTKLFKLFLILNFYLCSYFYFIFSLKIVVRVSCLTILISVKPNDFVFCFVVFCFLLDDCFFIFLAQGYILCCNKKNNYLENRNLLISWLVFDCCYFVEISLEKVSVKHAKCIEIL